MAIKDGEFFFLPKCFSEQFPFFFLVLESRMVSMLPEKKVSFDVSLTKWILYWEKRKGGEDVMSFQGDSQFFSKFWRRGKTLKDALISSLSNWFLLVNSLIYALFLCGQNPPLTEPIVSNVGSWCANSDLPPPLPLGKNLSTPNPSLFTKFWK